MTDKANNKMDDTQSNRTSVTCSITSSVTSAASSKNNPLNDLDFFALDLSDLLDSGVEAPSSSIAASASAAPFRRSLSAPNTAAMHMRASADRHHSNDKAKVGPPPSGIKMPQRVRRCKSNDDAPSPKPLFVRKSRKDRNNKDRSKSPNMRSTLRLPKLTRSRTCSPGREMDKMGGSSKKNTTAPFQRTVSFDKVQIREHEQILGDNPCTEVGPSLGLGWNYHEKKDTCLDKYESKRTGTTSLLMGTRRKSGVAGDVCSLSPMARTEKAIKLGYSAEEILANQKENQKVQKLRQRTLQEEQVRDTAQWVANQQAVLAPGA